MVVVPTEVGQRIAASISGARLLLNMAWRAKCYECGQDVPITRPLYGKQSLLAEGDCPSTSRTSSSVWDCARSSAEPGAVS